MEALGKHLLARGAVPLFVLLVGDLALDKQLRELSALCLALERHQAEASKRRIMSGLGFGEGCRLPSTLHHACNSYDPLATTRPEYVPAKVAGPTAPPAAVPSTWTPARPPVPSVTTKLAVTDANVPETLALTMA